MWELCSATGDECSGCQCLKPLRPPCHHCSFHVLEDDHLCSAYPKGQCVGCVTTENWCEKMAYMYRCTHCKYHISTIANTPTKTLRQEIDDLFEGL